MSDLLKAFGMMLDRRDRKDAREDQIAANAVNLVYKIELAAVKEPLMLEAI